MANDLNNTNKARYIELELFCGVDCQPVLKADEYFDDQPLGGSLARRRMEDGTLSRSPRLAVNLGEVWVEFNEGAGSRWSAKCVLAHGVSDDVVAECVSRLHAQLSALVSQAAAKFMKTARDMDPSPSAGKCLDEYRSVALTGDSGEPDVCKVPIDELRSQVRDSASGKGAPVVQSRGIDPAEWRRSMSSGGSMISDDEIDSWLRRLWRNWSGDIAVFPSVKSRADFVKGFTDKMAGDCLTKFLSTAKTEKTEA